jgi:hypothetical protein
VNKLVITDCSECSNHRLFHHDVETWCMWCKLTPLNPGQLIPKNEGDLWEGCTVKAPIPDWCPKLAEPEPPGASGGRG